MGLEREIPRRQASFYEFEPRKYEDYSQFLKKVLGTFADNPVYISIDLYCGVGYMTAGAITLFNCQAHAVDYHGEILTPSLRKDPRVIFHQGWVSDELMRGNLPEADLITIANASRHYGLEAVHFEALRRLTRGVIMTTGQNGGLENHPAFKQNFHLVHNAFADDAYIWKPRA